MKRLSLLRKCALFLILAALVSGLALPASADIAFEPNDSFYKSHSGNCHYEDRTYHANGPEGYVLIYTSPGGGATSPGGGRPRKNATRENTIAAMMKYWLLRAMFAFSVATAARTASVEKPTRRGSHAPTTGRPELTSASAKPAT